MTASVDVIRRRTPEERAAYLQGFRAGIDAALTMARDDLPEQTAARLAAYPDLIDPRQR